MCEKMFNPIKTQRNAIREGELISLITSSFGEDENC